MPLQLPRRLNLLGEMMGLSERISMIAVDGMADALAPHTAITIRTTAGATPLGRMPQMVWGDVFRYQEGCIDLLMNAALRDERVSIRRTAARRVPRALMNLVLRAQIRRSLPHLRTVVDEVIAETDTFDVSDGSFRACASGFRTANNGVHQLSLRAQRLQRTVAVDRASINCALRCRGLA